MALLPLPCGPKCCGYSMNPGFTDIDLLRILNKLDKKHGNDAITGLYVFVVQSLRSIQSIVTTVMTDHYQNAARKEREAMLNVSSAMPLDA